MPNLVEGFLWYFAFLFSLCFHEGAHALVGYRLGDDTAHDQGQVSMNPIPHIKQEPFGTVIVPILMFLSTGSMIGWASAPYNPSWALSFPKRSALVSLAGPVSNLIIVLTCSVIFRIGLETGFFQVAGWMSYADIVDPSGAGLSLGMARILGVLYSLNVLLFAFNLLPFPPLDGSGVVPLFLEEDTARRYMHFISNPAFLFVGVMVAWNLFDYIFDPIHIGFVNIVYLGITSY